MHTRPWKFAVALSLCGAVLTLVTGCSDEKSVAPQTPLIGLSTTTLEFSSPAGSPPYPAAQNVTVTNIGVGNMTFSASSDCPWIEILRVNDSDILITARSETLATGGHEDTVTITSTQASNSPRYIRVSVTVMAQIAVSPTRLDFVALSGGDNPDSQIVHLTALGGTETTYSAVSTPSWISLGNATGATPGELLVTIDISALAGGIYQDYIVITSPDVPGMLVRIPVRLAISSWSQRIPAGRSFVLRGVTFLDAQHGWASGYYPSAVDPRAVFCRTDDGGSSWEVVSNGMPTGAYEGLAFVDANTGWIAGDSGRLIKTLNGGDNWSPVPGLPVDSSISFVNLAFANPDSGWIIGSGGTILATTDSGDTWHVQSTPDDDDLSDLWFLNSREGWVCGNHGAIFHTSNGGTTWTTQAAGLATDLRGICFVDAVHGWAVGETGAMIRTTNGGTTWTPLTSVTDVLLLDVFFVSPTHGWVVGYGGLILQTADGGDNWEQQLSGTNYAIFDIFFVDENIGVVVGEAGVLLRTLSGGY